MVHKDGDGSCLALAVAAGDKLIMANCLYTPHGGADKEEEEEDRDI